MLLSGFLSGQSGNTEAKPVEGYEINGFITGKYTGKVYLVKEDGMHGPQTKVDSCEVKEGRFLTTKKEKEFHGYGIKSIRYTVNKYDGAVSIDTKENWFDLKILIPMKKTASDEVQNGTVSNRIRTVKHSHFLIYNAMVCALCMKT